MNKLKKWLKRKLREMLDIDEIDQEHIVEWCKQSEYELATLYSKISSIHEELDEVSGLVHYVSTGLTSSKIEMESNLSYIEDKLDLVSDAQRIVQIRNDLDSVSNTLDLKADKHEIVELINSSDERINGGRIIIDGDTLIEDGVFRDVQNER